MTTKDEALKQALDALEQIQSAMPFPSARNAIKMCSEALAHDHDDSDRTDAECFRFWVSEAARSPASIAKLIMYCTTEQEYRDAILPIVMARKAVIAKATRSEV